MQNIGWRTYVIFAALNLVNASLVWAFYPETAGLTLESIDKLFREYGIEKDKKRELEGSGDDLTHVDACEGTSQPWANVLQWPVVPRADAAVRRLKKQKADDGGDQSEGNAEVARRSTSGSASVEEKKAVEELVEAV